MKWSYSDKVRTGYVYPRNLPHHGPDGTFGAKVWPTQEPEPGPSGGGQAHFTTRDEAMFFVETWTPVA